jgi:superfamily II RNA helicase
VYEVQQMDYLHTPDLTTAPEPVADPAISYVFPLDNWQQHAIAAIHAGHNVLVTAKTGSGKTLVGEYQIAHSLREKKRVFYTTPIKSLSNQKYHDLKKLFPHASVGIMTGDIKSAPEADIVVMTTEILRNLLFKQSTATATVGTAGMLTLADVGAVIFDEVHYINDQDRGHVWEETLILLPPEIHLILLSATIDSPNVFAGWLGAAKKTPITLLSTSHRIVPLIHGVWDPSQHPLPLRPLKAGDEAPYNGRIYDDWLKGKELRLRAAEDWAARVGSAKAAGDSIAGATGKVKIQSFTHTLNMCVSTLKERDLMPALFFTLSRAGCEKNADAVSESLLDSSDAAEVKHIIRRHLHHYATTLEHLPQYHQITRLLVRGVAFHHSGLLPLLKEIVEILFARGYVKALFCTETFAVGLNMPARTAVFLDLKKPADGGAFRPLRPDEYIQMAGRAGRRGKDTQGVVIYLPSREPVSADELKGVMSGALVPLDSRLQFHYDFLLKAIHRSAAAPADSEPVWSAVIDRSYWAAQRLTHVATVEAEVERLRAGRALTTITLTDAEEMRTKQRLEVTVKTAVNAEKRRAAAALNAWNERHAGPRWRAAETAWKAYESLTRAIVAKESDLTILKAPADDKVAPVLAALKRHGALSPAAETPTLTPYGTLATEINEGNPLLIARLYDSGLLSKATAEEIVGVLGSFITEREALEKTTHPDYLSASPLTKSTLIELDNWAQEGRQIDADCHVQSPPEFWSLSTLWVEIAAEWLAPSTDGGGGEAGVIAAKYSIYEGNLMRGFLKLANLMNEWIALATLRADVEMLERLRDVPARLLRDIAVPESLYLRL